MSIDILSIDKNQLSCSPDRQDAYRTLGCSVIVSNGLCSTLKVTNVVTDQEQLSPMAAPQFTCINEPGLAVLFTHAREWLSGVNGSIVIAIGSEPNQR